MLQSVETIQNSHTSKTIIQTEYNLRHPYTNLDETTLKRSSQREKRKNNDDSRPPSYNLLKQSQPHFEIWSNNNIIQTTYAIPVQISMKQHGRLRSIVKKKLSTWNKQREKRDNSRPSTCNLSKQSKTIATTLWNLIEEYNSNNLRHLYTNLNETTLRRSSQHEKRKNSDDSRPPSCI